MKFKDLPIGTKFTDELEINISYFDYRTKTGDNMYCHEELGVSGNPKINHEWSKYWVDDVYPVLLWEDEMELLND